MARPVAGRTETPRTETEPRATPRATAVRVVTDRDRLAGALVDRIGTDRFARYFGVGTRFDVDAERVAVCVRDAFTAELIERRFGDQLRDAATAALGPGRAVTLEVDPALEGAIEPEADLDAEAATDEPARANGAARANGSARAYRADRSGTTARAARPTPPAWQTGQTFETFVLGPCNRVAAAAGRRMAENAEDDFGTLFVHGGCGMGKTHLLRAIAARFVEVRPWARVLFTTGEQFVGAFVAAVKTGSTTAFQKRHREVDLLVIDDVHAVGSKNKTQIELTNTLSALRDARARVVLASDCQPRAIEQVSEALASRLGQGLVARMDPPDEEVRRALIGRLLGRRGVPVTPGGVERLVELTARAESVRELEGVAAQVEAVWRVDGASGEVGVLLVDRAVAVRGAARGGAGANGHGGSGSTLNAGRGISEAAAVLSGPVPLERIVAEVCSRCGVQPMELGSNGRTRRVVLARSLIVLLARKMTNLSYPEIARGIGRPNHSTVITQIRAIEARIAGGERVAVGCSLDGRKIDEAAAYLERVVRNGGEPLAG